MSFTTQRRAGVLVGVLGLSLFLLAPLRGQDALNEAKARQEVLAQKFQKEVQDGVKRASSMARTRPQDALRELRALLSRIEGEEDLLPGVRQRLSLRLRASIDSLEWQSTRRQTKRDERSVQAAVRDENRRIQQQERRRPDNVQRRTVDTASSIIGSRQAQLAQLQDIRRRRNEGLLNVYKEVEKSAIPNPNDITFPDDWVEKSMKRSPRAKMTETERAILQQLNKPISVEFNKEPLQNVIEYLQKTAKIPITLDRQAMMDVGVNEETPVTLNMNGFSTRTVLKRLLGDLNLTYVVRDETVLVTSVQKARTMMTTRTYYIGDLLGYSNFALGLPINQVGVAEAVNTIIQTITQTDPDSWNANNPEAGGTVIYDPISMSLIVRQSAEFHMRHGGGH